MPRTCRAASVPRWAALLPPWISNDESVLFRAINANFRLGRTRKRGSARRLRRARDAPAARAEAIAQLAHWPKPLQRDRLVGIYRPIPVKSRDRAIAVQAVATIAPAARHHRTLGRADRCAQTRCRTLEIAGATDALFAVVRNENSGATRAAALNAPQQNQGSAPRGGGEARRRVVRLDAPPRRAADRFTNLAGHRRAGPRQPRDNGHR